MITKYRHLIFIILLAAGMLPEAHAQTAGSITGIVQDSAGGIIQGAELTIVHTETGSVRMKTTDTQGRYIFSGLPVGAYDIEAAYPGFQSTIHKAIPLSLGRTLKIDLVLQAGGTRETLIVTGEPLLVDTLTSAVSGEVLTHQIETLPLNGRDFTQLVTFQTGVATPPVSGGGTVKLSIVGGRPYETSYLLDGTDISRWDGRPSGVAGVTLGVEAIREFSVLTNSFSTEYGGTGVSLVSSVTKSGSNTFHGNAYYYMRNSALDAKNYFDSADEPIPDFRRNQFGGSLGGPIVRNRLFFFANYEGFRQSLGVTNTLRVPSDTARLGLIADPSEVDGFRQVTINPGSEIWLTAFPEANSPRTFGADIGEAVMTTTEPTREDYFTVRMDYAISSNDRFSARYTFDDSRMVMPGASAIEGLAIIDNARNQYGTLEYSRIFSPRHLNTLRFGVSRNADSSAWEVPPLAPEFSLIPGTPLGRLSVTGLTAVGVDTYRPNSWISNVFDLNDTFTWSAGAHVLKLGGQYKRTQVQTVADLRFSGQISFTTLENFLTGKTSRLSGVLPGSSSYRGYRRSYAASFIHDDWRLSRDLTLTLGLRWEYMGAATEVNGKVSTLEDVYTSSEFTVGNPWFQVHNTLKGFAPRVGFAWDPSGRGTFAVRGAFGIFAEQIKESNYAGARGSPPFVTDIVVNRPPWPYPLEGNITVPKPSPTVMETDPKIPVVYQWNLMLQTKIFRDWVITAGYLGSRSLHLGSVGCPNCAVPSIVDGRYYWEAGLKRPNQAFEYIRYLTMDASAYYNALQLRLEKRFSSGLAFQGSFTFSKTMDTGSAQGGSELGGVGNIFTRQMDQDRKSEKGLSSFDIRRNLSLNCFYELPIGPGRSFGNQMGRRLQLLAAGWNLSTIMHFTDGSPANIHLDFNRSRSLHDRDIADRPDLRPGASNNPVLGDPSRYYDPTAFVLQPEGYAGNLGRNTLTLPGYTSIDVSLAKKFDVSGDSMLEFRAEIFNVLNHPNFAAPDLVPILGEGLYNPTAGVIGETRGTSRQIQFALRYSF